MTLNGEKVRNQDELFRVTEKHQVGETVQVLILRDGQRMTVPVRLTEAADTRR